VPDAYSKWLEIPEHRRPPTYYQLLGVAPSELDPNVIAAAAERQLERLRPHVLGPGGDECRRLEQEVVQARNTLLDPLARQRYDQLTPDAAQPWWTPDGDQVAAAPPVPVDGWWQPDSPPAETQSKAAPESVKAVPVEGWWQGETPEPQVAPEPAISLSVSGLSEALQESKPEPASPAPTKADDWWRKPAAELPQVSPPPAREPVPIPPPIGPAVSLTQPPAPTPAPRPIVSEKALTYPTPASTGSPAKLIALGVGVIAAIAIGILLWKKPWESTEPQPIARTNPETVGPKKIDPIGAGTTTKVDPETIDIEPRVVEGPKEIVKVDPKPKNDPKPPDAVEFSGPVTLRGHQGGVYGVAVGRNGKTVLSVGEDRNVLQHAPRDEAKAAHVHKLLSPGVGVALCREDHDAVFCDGGDVIVYDMATRKMTRSFENPRGGIRCLAAATDGSFILTGATDGCVRWWSVASKSLAHTLDVDEKAAVSAVAIAPDAKSAALGLSDGRLCMWDLQKRREVKRWTAHKGSVTAVAFSPDGKRLASAGDDNQAAVWQTSGTLVKKLSGHEGPVLAVGWCSDGQRVLTGGVDKQIRLWSEPNGWKADWTPAASDKVFSIAIDSHDRFVAAGLSSGEVRLIPLPSLASKPMKDSDQ
jgi:hypothetical protein